MTIRCSCHFWGYLWLHSTSCVAAQRWLRRRACWLEMFVRLFPALQNVTMSRDIQNIAGARWLQSDCTVALWTTSVTTELCPDWMNCFTDIAFDVCLRFFFFPVSGDVFAVVFISLQKRTRCIWSLFSLLFTHDQFLHCSCSVWFWMKHKWKGSLSKRAPLADFAQVPFPPLYLNSSHCVSSWNINLI